MLSRYSYVLRSILPFQLLQPGKLGYLACNVLAEPVSLVYPELQSTRRHDVHQCGSGTLGDAQMPSTEGGTRQVLGFGQNQCNLKLAR